MNKNNIEREPIECEASPFRKPLAIKDDPFNGIVTIDGVSYSYEFFKGFAEDMPIDKAFKIVRRETSRKGTYITIAEA